MPPVEKYNGGIRLDMICLYRYCRSWEVESMRRLIATTLLTVMSVTFTSCKTPATADEQWEMISGVIGIFDKKTYEYQEQHKFDVTNR